MLHHLLLIFYFSCIFSNIFASLLLFTIFIIFKALLIFFSIYVQPKKILSWECCEIVSILRKSLSQLRFHLQAASSHFIYFKVFLHFSSEFLKFLIQCIFPIMKYLFRRNPLRLASVWCFHLDVYFGLEEAYGYH